MAERLALIIANSDFEDEKLCRLKTPTRDAKALAEVLGDPDIGDFDVTLLIDKPEPLVRRRIARLYYRRKRSDLLLLYYSGHGIRDAHGDLYLATRDTEMDIAGATALSASFVREQLDKSNSQRKVVMLDCCHSGAFAKAGLGDSVGTEDAFAGSGYGRVILTASDALELSWEGDEWLGEGQPSVFTNFLVEGLCTGAADLDGDGKIELDELYDYVYEQVMTSGYAKQTPHKWAQQVEGQIFIAHAPELDEGLPGWIIDALSSAAFTARLAAVGELAQLIQGDNRALAAAARAELKRLSEEEDNLAVRGAAAGALGAGSPVVSRSRPESLSAIKKPQSEPKPDVLTITSPIHLELVRVPAGEFLMGSDPVKDKDAKDWEQPQHTVELPAFYIGKYPITNAQYAAFVQAADHRTPFYWRSNDKFPLGKEYHPVSQVSWKDAVAFCRWLSREINKIVRLPSEAEWEKASRGIDGRIYPWGDKLPTVSLCNFDDYVRDTTPVGHYLPLGGSPYGCADMAGNVWEWTRSAWRRDYFVKDSVFGYPYNPGDGRESLKINAPRVLRGGAFHNSSSYVRCASRRSSSQNNSGNRFGFRVCVVSGKD